MICRSWLGRYAAAVQHEFDPTMVATGSAVARHQKFATNMVLGDDTIGFVTDGSCRSRLSIRERMFVHKIGLAVIRRRGKI